MDEFNEFLYRSVNPLTEEEIEAILKICKPLMQMNI